MMQTLSKYKGIIIGVVVIILIFVGYAIFKKDKPEGKNGVVETVVSVPGSEAAAVENSAAEFALQLSAIQTINFNVDFFKDPVYQGLVDQSRPLGVRDVGRPNPFLDIGKDGTVFPGDDAIGEAPATFVQTTVSTTTATSTKTTTGTNTPGSATSTPRR